MSAISVPEAILISAVVSAVVAHLLGRRTLRVDRNQSEVTARVAEFSSYIAAIHDLSLDYWLHSKHSENLAEQTKREKLIKAKLHHLSEIFDHLNDDLKAFSRFGFKPNQEAQLKFDEMHFVSLDLITGGQFEERLRSEPDFIRAEKVVHHLLKLDTTIRRERCFR